MAVYNVKSNKCFAEALTLKYKGSRTDTVEAGDFAYYTFYSDNITEADACVVTVVHTGSGTIDEITTAHVITDGAVQVKVNNSGAADAEITVNIVVL